MLTIIILVKLAVIKIFRNQIIFWRKISEFLPNKSSNNLKKSMILLMVVKFTIKLLSFESCTYYIHLKYQQHLLNKNNLSCEQKILIINLQKIINIIYNIYLFISYI
ncbi:hypothetical protein PPERSA_06903 [Pseudocohnilembus persalinus]|uniref:Uncharacterized protein n=1 Tax=Pseudocohnilembus persalinus TaxID=266149 RepID=A0A0V0QZG6_PSEPJ|nr:hypothetical protein PPERSA_06903 [Pseudocohnilembus persalinus]|eukprot:KRX07288.1 hypothetical protein PPERSA_06903 [Pseudocohnilembus persalinus]